MKTRYIKDSGVCFARNPQSVLFLSSRKLYLPFHVFKHFNHVIYTFNLSGCALRHCKFPTLTCDKCSFNY